jgi:hypothetical protein
MTKAMIEARAADIRTRLRADMSITLGANLPELVLDPDRLEATLDNLLDDAMHQVEQLLSEVSW